MLSDTSTIFNINFKIQLQQDSESTGKDNSVNLVNILYPLGEWQNYYNLLKYLITIYDIDRTVITEKHGACHNIIFKGVSAEGKLKVFGCFHELNLEGWMKADVLCWNDMGESKFCCFLKQNKSSNILHLFITRLCLDFSELTDKEVLGVVNRIIVEFPMEDNVAIYNTIFKILDYEKISNNLE